MKGKIVKVVDRVADKLGYEPKKKKVIEKKVSLKTSKIKTYIKFIDDKGNLKIEKKIKEGKIEKIDVLDTMTVTELYNYLSDWNQRRR